jgi:hypothetical protein
MKCLLCLYLTKCQEIKEFSELRIDELGKFSHDSKFYDFKKVVLDKSILNQDERGYIEGSWRFDLTTRKLTQL